MVIKDGRKSIVYERYNNVYTFVNTVSTRPHTETMRGQNGSTEERDGNEWYGGYSWAGAVSAFENGIPETAATIKKELDRFKVAAAMLVNKSRPRNYYHGYAPNVPAAIIGHPKAMRQNVRQPHKVKAVQLFYDSTQNASTRAETLTNAGIATLKLIHLLELNGYRVQLTLVGFTGEKNRERALLAIDLKDYRQPLDILKLTFPLTSPAMFRRFGFKWLETLDGITDREWRGGYGSHTEKEELFANLRAVGVKLDNAHLITVDDCKGANFDPVKLAETLKIKVG